MLRDAELLAKYLVKRQVRQATLAREVKCSRQMIHQLLTGELSGCSPDLAARIEEHLGLVQGTLFMPAESRRRRSKIA